MKTRDQIEARIKEAQDEFEKVWEKYLNDEIDHQTMVNRRLNLTAVEKALKWVLD